MSYNTHRSFNRVLLLTLLVAALSSSVFAEPQSPYGICAHVSRHGDRQLAPQQFKLMRRAGIRWARTDFDWTTVQPTQNGPWDFSMLDATVDQAEQAGITILPILAYDVAWATPAYKHLDQWLEYVRKTVTRYKDRLTYWEVWNEPDLLQFWKETPDPANYTVLLKATYQEIKKINPNLKVLLGGVSGIPYEYLEGIYQAGGKDFFDIMAVHPYRYPETPEGRSLKEDLDKLQKLMEKYGDKDKPVWITEIGWPTHQSENFLLDDIVRAGLSVAETERTEWTLAVFDDAGYPVQNNISDGRLKGMLPGTGKIVRLNLEQMKNLTAGDYHALMMPPEEGFPAECFDTIEQFVRDGGIVIFTQGVPLYYASRQQDDGSWTRQGADESYRRRLHIGWEAWWTKQGVPKEIATLSVPADIASKIRINEQHAAAERFLTDTALKPGDRFVPLIQASSGDYTGTAAALYDLNSDLKGAVIVSALKQDFRGIPEEKQASILPRAYLIAMQSGVECMFWYNLRARENNPFYNEDHFGIIHKDLKPKEAYIAMKALSKARPAGSVALSKSWQTGSVFCPGWKRPDGQTAFAIWSMSPSKRNTVTVEGTLTQTFDHLGKSLNIQPQNGKIQILLSENPIYLIGPENINIDAP